LAVPLDEPGPRERDERRAELLDRRERADPEQVLLRRPVEPLGAAVALALRTKAGELSTPGKRIAAWEWWLTYRLP
jgi:hypothetical protein